MGNTGNIGIHKESKSIGNENDHAHSQNTSSTSCQQNVPLGSESRESFIRKEPDAEKGNAEKLREEFVETSPISMIKVVVKTDSKETPQEIFELSMDSCDRQYMEWIKLRGTEYRPRNKMKASSEAPKLKCWTVDNELFLDKVPKLSLDETKPTDGFEKTQSMDLFPFDDSDSCLKDARSYDRDAGSISYTVLSELSTGPNRKFSVSRSEARHAGSDSLTATWEQESSSDESVKHLYCSTYCNGFEKGLPKHTESKESADRIEFKTNYFSGPSKLGVPGKNSGCPKGLRPRVKVNHRTPVVQQIRTTDL